jgi:hypothetical protein
MAWQGPRSAAGIFLAAIWCAMPAVANDVQMDQVKAKIGGVVSVGTSIRSESSDPQLVPVPNAAAVGIPGRAPAGRTQDDGNLNFRRGEPVSTVLKALIDLRMTYQDFGVHVRANAWRDFALTDTARAWGNQPNGYTAGVPLGEGSNSVYGRFSGAALLDANVYGTVHLAGRPLYAKIGNQLLPWGAPTSIAGGLSTLNPINFPAVRRPGALPDEVGIPFPAVFARLGLADRLAVEGFYQLAFQRTEPFPCGTFFSTLDYLSDRCDKVVLGAGLNDRQLVATGNFTKRGPDRWPSDHGQFGLGLTYDAEPIATRLGAYYAQYHSRGSAIGVLKAGRANPFISGDPDGLNPRYFIQHPEDIRMFGLSLVTQRVGITLFAEAVHRPNQPIQLNGVDLTNAAVSSTAPSLVRAEYDAVPLGGVYDAYDRRQVSDLMLGASAALTGLLGAKGLLLGAELGIKHVHDLPDPNLRRYGRVDVVGVPPFGGACIGPGYTALSCTNDGFVSATAYGMRARAALTYPELFADITIIPSVSYGYDIRGWSYDGVFSEGRHFAVIGLRADYKKRYSAEIIYQPVWGGRYSNVRDRDVLTFAVSARF